MNTCKALLIILLAWSTTQLTPQQDIDFGNGPISEVFTDLDFDLQMPNFDLLFNEDTAEKDSFTDNMQVYLLDTLTALAEENIEESFFFNAEISTPFEVEIQENEISLEDLITPSEEVQEILRFINQENDFFQSISQKVDGLFDDFNEELTSLIALSNLYENAENTEEIIVLPSAVSGIAFAMVDGLNGIDGEEEKGEENLEARYNFVLTDDSRFNLAGETKSFDIYLGGLCVVIAAIIVGVVAKGLSLLRKNETVIEEDNSSNYIEIDDEGSI